jgi:hypothetical protein
MIMTGVSKWSRIEMDHKATIDFLNQLESLAQGGFFGLLCRTVRKSFLSSQPPVPRLIVCFCKTFATIGITQ